MEPLHPSRTRAIRISSAKPMHRCFTAEQIASSALNPEGSKECESKRTELALTLLISIVIGRTPWSRYCSKSDGVEQSRKVLLVGRVRSPTGGSEISSIHLSRGCRCWVTHKGVIVPSSEPCSGKFGVLVKLEIIPPTEETHCELAIEEPGVMNGCPALGREIFVKAGVFVLLDLPPSDAEDTTISSPVQPHDKDDECTETETPNGVGGA